jgi:hypothetical protein
VSTPPGFWNPDTDDRESHEIEPTFVNPPEQPAPLSAKEQRAPTLLASKTVDTAPMFQGEPLEAVEALMKMTRRIDETYREVVAGTKPLSALRPVLDATVGVRLFLERMIGPMVHRLKCDPEPFQKVLDGLKRYEVRKFDRDYKVGDRLQLLEFDRTTQQYSGRRFRVKITTITEPGSFGLPADVGVLGIEPVEE